LKVNFAEIVISAVTPKQYPKNFLPEIALAGRSNVGKSSFINRLLKRKNLARTSSKPGKTQTLNFYLVNELFFFVDVPGYGYAKVSKTEREKWGKMIEDYLTTRKMVKAVILLVDFRHLPTSDDIQMANFLIYYNIPFHVVFTKVDKVSKSKRQGQLQQAINALEIRDDTEYTLFSATTGEGFDKAWQVIEEAIKK